MAAGSNRPDKGSREGSRDKTPPRQPQKSEARDRERVDFARGYDADDPDDAKIVVVDTGPQDEPEVNPFKGGEPPKDQVDDD